MNMHRTVCRRGSTRYIVFILIIGLVLITIKLSMFTCTYQTMDSFLSNSKTSRQNVGNIIQNLKQNSISITNTSTSVTCLNYVPVQKSINGVTKTQTHITTNWADCRRNPNAKTGNVLIDNYGDNDLMLNGENGRGVIFVGEEMVKAKEVISQYNVNVMASDITPLNRMVPDVRFKGCANTTFPEVLPSASIIITFHDEWPSVLYRTVYSIVNRTPRHLLQEIILVDDGSTMERLHGELDRYIERNFPAGLIKLIRLPERTGLIQARLAGWRNSTGDVIIIFDSHMEVNIDWLQPLLTEVKADRKTLALGTLDYIQPDTLEYRYNPDYMTRYGFDWRLVFFETFFRNDQIGEAEESTRPGTVMVGTAYAIDSKYFEEIGTYDEAMKVWGGENLELAWRIWLCGGRLVHTPCSHIGHIARGQPYTFPGGREEIEQFNYKRAVDVWMEPEYREFVYSYFPNMKTMDVGDLTSRLELKKRLQCKPFSWLLENVWPELFVYNKNVTAWGSARNLHTNKCLDNGQYLFQAPEPLHAEACHYQLPTQGFSMTKGRRLRTSLQCVVLKQDTDGARPKLEDCIIGPPDTWTHKQDEYIKHARSGLCLDMDDQGPVVHNCSDGVVSQKWQFNTYVHH